MREKKEEKVENKLKRKKKIRKDTILDFKNELYDF